ncbi:hypothetical protein ACQP2F_41010 [Actinoplanes sp. CA-030573]|uniref:hypothetical protein n=1 Tax=Actinoplanes sp. CA-030573 TaxID=3239898 RepID=UPI003D8B1681
MTILDFPDLTGGDAIADRIAELITDLGDTPDAIAYHLAEAGITGRRGEATCCPIAVYLRRAEPGIDWIGVFDDAIDVLTETACDLHLNVSDAVGEFVALFDIERYPHLIGTSGEAA